jgi:hypothetical protein
MSERASLNDAMAGFYRIPVIVDASMPSDVFALVGPLPVWDGTQTCVLSDGREFHRTRALGVWGDWLPKETPDD